MIKHERKTALTFPVCALAIVCALLVFCQPCANLCHAEVAQDLLTEHAAEGARNKTPLEVQTAGTLAKSAIVVERSSGRVLYAKNPDIRLPNASTTKIATALTVLRHVPDLDRVVTVCTEACGVEGSSVYLQAGEKLTVRDLLYGLLLRSGNDCAVQLAYTVGESVQKFVELMNDEVRSLGCNDTNFVTPHGLHDESHFTTARDLAEITRAALANADFAQIVSSRTYRVTTDGSTRVFVNKNKLLANFDGADGVKTGFTKKAGRCFVGSATRNGMGVVAVVLDCAPMFEDTARLLNKAFVEFTLQMVLTKNRICGATTLPSGKRAVYVCPQKFAYPLKADENCRVEFLPDGRAVADVYVNDNLVAELPLRAVPR